MNQATKKWMKLSALMTAMTWSAHSYASEDGHSKLDPGQASYGTFAEKKARKKIIIDTDMAIDDWIAMLYLFNHPRVDVRAVTITGA